MTDDELVAKFLASGDGVLPTDKLERVIKMSWEINELDDVAALIECVQ